MTYNDRQFDISVSIKHTLLFTHILWRLGIRRAMRFNCTYTFAQKYGPIS